MFDLGEFDAWLRDWSDDLLKNSDPYGCFVWRDEPGPNLLYINDLVWIRWMLGELEPTAEQRRAWAETINSFQSSEGGFYRNPDFETHSWQHATWRALVSLNMLGGWPRYPLKFLEPLREVETGRQWVREYGSHPVSGGHHRYALAPLAASLGVSDQWVDTFFAEIHALQSPKTGFWGLDAGGLSPTFLITVLHLAFQREIPNTRSIVDTALFRQQEDGFYSPDGQPGFAEMDAAFLLDRLSKATGYRREEALAALARMEHTLSRLWEGQREEVFNRHPHSTLAICGICSVLQEALPERVMGERRWPFVYGEAELLRIPLG